jgi:hypothetical protein
MLAYRRFLLLVAAMRALSIAAMIAMLTVPAHAQMGHGKGEQQKQKSNEDYDIQR